MENILLVKVVDWDSVVVWGSCRRNGSNRGCFM